MSKNQKNKYEGWAVLFLYGVIIIQALFSVAWISYNWFGVENNYLALDYIKAADTLVVDDYMGILYALIIRVLGHGTLLFIAQYIAVGVSACCAFGISGGLLVITNPFILVCCFSALPHALIFSALLFLIWALLKLEKGALLAALIIDGFVIGLLTPTYIFAFGFIAIFLLIVSAITRNRKALILLSAAIICVSTCTFINKKICTIHAYERADISVDYLNMQRLAWPYINGFSPELLMYQGNAFLDECTAATRNPEKLAFWGYSLEKELGNDNARAFYRHMSDEYKKHGLTAYKPFLCDLIGYFAAPFAVPVYYMTDYRDIVFGRTILTLVGENYLLFKIYMWFSVVSGASLSILGVIKCIYEKNGYIVIMLGIAAIVALYSSYFCIRGFDYRNACFVMVSWAVSFPVAIKKGI